MHIDVGRLRPRKLLITSAGQSVLQSRSFKNNSRRAKIEGFKKYREKIHITSFFMYFSIFFKNNRRFGNK